MRKLCKWFWMLSKRLYKKPSFLALLILIPVCVAAFTIAAAQDSGFVHIVLAQENKADALSSVLVQELTTNNTLLHVTVADTHEDAIRQVENGTADEAWLFPSDTGERVDKFVRGKASYVVSVVTREQSVTLRLAREKLTGTLYRHCARAYYLEYIRTRLADEVQLSEAQQLAYFDEATVDDDLFSVNDAEDRGTMEEPHYLVSPIRGLLAILVVLCGMAATMYYMQDEAAGTFAHVPQKRKGLAAFGCVVTAVFNVAVFVAVALYVSALAGTPVREVPILLLYTLCCTAFCLLLKQVFVSIRAYAATIPLLAVLLIAVCPVFFNFKQLLSVQLLFPPTYYVNAVYDMRYCGYMAAYTVACLLVCAVLHSFRTVLKRLR